MKTYKSSFSIFLHCSIICISLAISNFSLAKELEAIKITPNVFYFQGESGQVSVANQGFMSNSGFVITKDQVVVIDTLGTPVLGEAMIKAIRKVSSLPIKIAFITHYHADHYYGNQAFKSIGTEIWAEKHAKNLINSDQAKERLAQRRRDLTFFVDENTNLIEPDQLINENKTITLGNVNFQLIVVGGAHSPEDLMVYVENEKVLFAGDLFFSGRVPFVGDANTSKWLKALDKMLANNPKIVVPGHGKASSNPLPDIKLTYEYLSYLRSKMGEAVEQLTPFEEAYASTDWSAYDKLPAFASANRLNAYNIYIEMERESLNKK